MEGETYTTHVSNGYLALRNNYVYDDKNDFSKLFKNQKLPFKHVRKSIYQTNHFSGEMVSAEGKDFKFSRNIHKFEWDVKRTKIQKDLNYDLPYKINLRLSELEQVKELDKYIKKIGTNPIHSIEYGEILSTCDLATSSFNELITKVRNYAYKNNIKFKRQNEKIYRDIIKGTRELMSTVIDNRLNNIMKSLAAITCGYTDNLLQRAADVCLKENRRVVLIPREMPLGKVHLRNLLTANELGCVIVPPVLTFYNKPESIEDHMDHILGKALMQFDIELPHFKPWKGVENVNK